MNKTVLFLMNGFGIEQLDSYNIYNKEYTPNLDFYTNNELFSKLDANAYDLKSAYRMFSTGSSYPLTSLLLDNYIDKLEQNNNFKLFISSIKENSKINLFLSFDNSKNFEHIKKFINIIRKQKSNPIFLHLVLTSHDYNSYKELERLISKITYDLPDCKLGIIMGENLIKNNDLTGFVNMFTNEIGENWKDVNKKCSSLEKLKIKPVDVKEFYVNLGFNIKQEDCIFFFNYEYLDYANIVNKIKEKVFIEPYSMFLLNGIKYPLLAYPKSGISMANNLKKIDARALILSTKENIKQINYYCQGLENIVSENIEFSRTDNGLSPEQIKAIIRDSDYDLIVINFPIDNVKTVSEINKKMESLDSFLKIVHDFCLENNISLFISSLFGLQKTLKVDNFIDGHVDFLGKVPLLVVDNRYNKDNCSIGSGNIYDLATTIYKNINNKFTGQTLIKSKNSFEKILSK